MAVKKVPPPVGIATKDPEFNRWLLELTAIINAGGNIDPGSVVGLEALIASVAALSLQVGALNGTVADQGGDITSINGQIASINGQVAAINISVAALQGRAQVFRGTGAPAAGLGAVNDWYGDTAGAAGARIWIKTAVGVWTAFPF